MRLKIKQASPGFTIDKVYQAFLLPSEQWGMSKVLVYNDLGNSYAAPLQWFMPSD